jgi:hypothetical protein
MFRAGTSPSAANVMVTAHAGGYAEMQYRTMSGTYKQCYKNRDSLTRYHSPYNGRPTKTGFQA